MRRIGILALSDKDGVIDSYVKYIIENAIKCVKELHVVCCGNYDEKQIQDAMADEKPGEDGKDLIKIISPDQSVDGKTSYVGQWACALEKIDLTQADEVILLNDRFFGPFVSFESIFQKMEEKEADFWGLNQSVFKEGKDAYFYLADQIIGIRKNVFLHPSFVPFWDDMKKKKAQPAEFRKTFSTYFKNAGFQAATYCDFEQYYGNKINDQPQELYMPDVLIKKNAYPVLPLEALEMDYLDLFTYSAGEGVAKTMQILKEQGIYDLDLIWDYLLRTRSISDIRQKLGLNLVLPKNKEFSESEKPVKAAIIYHIYYMDILDQAHSYLSNVPEYMDIYVTTGSPEKKKIIEEKFADLTCHSFKVILVENRGRDVAAFLAGCKDFVSDYDYVCFTHDKKSSGGEHPFSVGNSFYYLTAENVLASRDYIRQIIENFEKNDRLGLLCPPAPLHNVYFSAIGQTWTNNFPKCLKLMRELGVHVPAAQTDEVMTFGTSFWFRTKALKGLFAKNWMHEDFPQEPLGDDGSISHAIERVFAYFVQQEGFYSSWVMTSEYASREIANLNYTLSQTVAAEQKRNLYFQDLFFKDFLERRDMAAEGMSYKDYGTVYYDYGDGFSQENSDFQLIEISPAGEFFVKIHVPAFCPDRLRRIRLDFMEDNFQISLSSIKMGAKDVSLYSHNGVLLPDKSYYFKGGRPQLVFACDKQADDLVITGRCVRLTDLACRAITETCNIQDVALYWDEGNDFSEDLSRHGSIALDEKGRFIFECDFKASSRIQCLRFDPIKKKNLVFIPQSITLNGKAWTGRWKHKGIELKKGQIRYMKENPFLMIPVANEGLDGQVKVVIKGRMIE